MKHLPAKTCLALLLTASVLAITSDSAPAALPKIKVKARLVVAVDLQPTAEAPEGLAASAVISVKQKNARQDARLHLDIQGLSAGEYSVDATSTDGESIHLATVEVEDVKGRGKSGDEIKLEIPDEVDARTFASMTVSDSTSTVLLAGDATTSTRLLRYFANVRVTAPTPAEEEGVTPESTDSAESTEVLESAEPTETIESSDPVEETESTEETETDDATPVSQPTRVHGHVLIHSTIAKDDVKKSKFLFIGHGAPASTTLTINVDGVAVGTVDSTTRGKVKFTTLPEEISLPAIRVISITDSLGEAIMQAQF